MDVAALIPQSKFDVKRAKAAVDAGYPAVAPILPELLAWLQDANWPVAQVLAGFLASIGTPLAPLVSDVLKSDDWMWKYWVVDLILGYSEELAGVFRPELERLVHAPSAEEAASELNDVAEGVLEKFGWA